MEESTKAQLNHASYAPEPRTITSSFRPVLEIVDMRNEYQSIIKRYAHSPQALLSRMGFEEVARGITSHIRQVLDARMMGIARLRISVSMDCSSESTT